MGATLFLVLKKDSKRLVINDQKLNKVIEKNSTLLPKINNILDQFKKSQLLIKIKLKDAFNKRRIEEGDE